MNSKRIIQFTPENEQPPRTKGLTIDGVVKLEPGYNSIEEEVYQKVKDSFPFKQRMKWGAIKVTTSEPVEAPVEDSIASIPNEDAIALVAQTISLDKLNKWKQEIEALGGKNKVSVLNALNRQIQTVKKGEL